MRKTGSRSAPVVNFGNQSHEIDPLDIAANMERHLKERLDKTGVQSANSTIYEQITSIINGVKPKYPSVSAAVADMQERSGFTSYQIEKNNFANMKQKQANNDKQNKLPKMFEEHPQIKETFDNYINDTRGNISIPAVLDKVKSLHRYDVQDDSWNDDDLLEYIDRECNAAKKDNPMPDTQGLGKLTHFNDTTDVDPSNNDAFFSLSPVSKSASIKTAAISSVNDLLAKLAVFDTPKK